MTAEQYQRSSDGIGRSTLEALSGAYAFNAWMYDQIARYVGRRVLEIGSGLGNLTSHIRAERIFASDIAADYLEELERKFSGDERVSVHTFDISSVPPVGIQSERIDTIICLNVLEHVPEEEKALRTMYELLQPGGNLLLLVPFAPWLFNPMDEHLGHVRRYNHRTVREAVGRVGFEVLRTFAFNFFGGIGWFVRGSLLRRRTLSEGSIGLFEKLTPIFRLLETFGTPFGSSIVCIARKPVQVDSRT